MNRSLLKGFTSVLTGLTLVAISNVFIGSKLAYSHETSSDPTSFRRYLCERISPCIYIHTNTDFGLAREVAMVLDRHQIPYTLSEGGGIRSRRCISWRSDIGGTRMGAIILNGLLGGEWRVSSEPCSPSGWAYVIVP